MDTDFTNAMSERTDQQLAEIITVKKDEYQPNAVLAAEKEFQKRNLNLDDFKVEARVPTNHSTNGIERLAWYHKVLTVLFPAILTPLLGIIVGSIDGLALIQGLIPLPTVVLIQYLIYKRLKNSGNTILAAEFLKWVTYTYYIYIGSALVIALAIYLLS